MIKRTVFVTAMLAISALVAVAQPSPEEAKGIQEIQAAAPQGIDAMATAVDNFVTKFPKSQYRGTVLAATADGYEARGNSLKAQVYYQRTIDADPKNYYAMLMLSTEIARGIKENVIDEAKKTADLNKAEKLAKDGLSILALATKPNPDGKDEEWATLKKDDEALGHEALGMIAMVRKKYDVAVSEFKQASTGGSGPRPAAMIRLAGAYNEELKYADAVTTKEKVLAIKDLPEVYVKAATDIKKASTEARDAKK